MSFLLQKNNRLGFCYYKSVVRSSNMTFKKRLETDKTTMTKSVNFVYQFAFLFFF